MTEDLILRKSSLDGAFEGIDIRSLAIKRSFVENILVAHPRPPG
jgi:hypothetical protein